MSGDVQPRKRKDKRRKKGQLEARRSEEYLEESTVFKQGYAAAQIQDDEEIHHTTSGSDEIIHIQKDSRLGGNICAKIVFFCLLGGLGVMIGLILTEYRGSSDVETQSPVDSPWSQMLEGWVDDSFGHHDEADSHGVDHDHEELGEEDIHSEEERSEEEEEEDHESEHHDEDESEEHEVDEEDSNEDKDEDDVSEENVSNEVEQEDDEDDDNESAEEVENDDNDEEEEDNEDVSDEEDQVDSNENDDDSQENEDDDSVDELVRETDEDDESGEEQDEKDQTEEEDEEEDTHESKEEEDEGEEDESYEETVNELKDEESEDDEESIEAASAEKMKEYEAQMKDDEEEEEEEEDTPNIIKDEKEDEEEQDVDEEEQDVVEEVESQEKPDKLSEEEAEAQVEEEEETTGVALKFGVGVALVVVAHVVLVRKWNRCGEEGIEHAQDEGVSRESVTEVPDLTRRQTLIPPSVEPPVTSPPAEQHVTEEYEYSEQEYEDEEEEEEDEKHVMETLEDLKAKYQQMTPEDSDVEPAEEDFDTKPTYTPTPPHSEPEEEQSEVEEEEEEEEEDDPLAQWKSVRGREMLAEEVEEVQTGSESEEEEEEPPPVPPIRRGGPRSSNEQVDQNVVEEQGDEQVIDEKVVEEQEYVNADITNAEDWEFREELDLADAELNNGKPEIALNMFTEILTHHPHSPRAYHGKAQALDQLAEAKRSNQLLMSAINTYLEAIEQPNIPDKLFLRLANRTIDRMRFKGLHLKAVSVHHKLISRFHTDPQHRNQLAVNYMMINRLADAELILEQTRQRWPGDGLTQAYYGLVLKLRGKHVESIPLLRAGINSQAEGTTDSHFYFHLGDALSRHNKTEEAMQVYAKGVEKGLFRSVYQRSLYNVDRLKAQPWWTIEETTYASFFKKLEENWKVIRDEGLSALKAQTGFEDEAESLRDTGNWKQFELFARGQKYHRNCERTPITCRLIEDFPPASGCRRGQTKFSVMEGGTHVWPHCGPTNCRLRAHLGLVVPNGTAIRVAEDTRNWAEGKVFIFDDSFEHEVWHKGTEKRLVLIVDVWHPELTPNERATLTTI